MENTFSRLVQAVSALAGLSFIFYVAGTLWYLGYYNAIGVPFKTSIPYNEYVLFGALVLLPIVTIYFPFATEKIFLLWSLRKDKKTLLESETSLLEGEAQLLRSQTKNENGEQDQEVKELLERAAVLKTEVSELKERGDQYERSLFSDWDSTLERVVMILLVSIYLACLVYFFKSGILSTLLLFICSYLVYRFIKMALKKDLKSLHGVLMGLPILLSVIILLYPFITGYASGKKALEKGSFQKVFVTEKDKVYEAQFISSNDDGYLLIINGSIQSISKEVVERMRWGPHAKLLKNWWWI